MLLSELLDSAGVTPENASGDFDFSGVTEDSRDDQAGRLFVLKPVAEDDSIHHIQEALQKGAAGLIVTSKQSFHFAKGLGAAVCLIAREHFEDALWRVCKVAFGNPSSRVRLIGITGTNGKTTTAWILRQLLTKLGRRACYVGTLGYLDTKGSLTPLRNTTPFPIELNNLLSNAQADGAEDVVMEVSSHALAQHRCDGLDFACAVFTNLSQDHLDFHQSMEEYESVKYRLFGELLNGNQSVLNVNDPVGRKWASRLPNVVTYGREGDLSVALMSMSQSEMTVKLSYRDEVQELTTNLAGEFNVENLAAAVATLLAIGHGLGDIVKVSREIQSVPGRFEILRCGKSSPTVVVDFAHTPDALEKLLHAARSLNPERLITVFGCGGNRDKSKRPLMGAIARELSDEVILTSDNPRTEAAGSILDEIRDGTSMTVVEDRRTAIHQAIHLAGPNDVVVIAGKGHENYQIIGSEKIQFSDQEVALEELSLR